MILRDGSDLGSACHDERRIDAVLKRSHQDEAESSRSGFFGRALQERERPSLIDRGSEYPTPEALLDIEGNSNSSGLRRRRTILAFVCLIVAFGVSYLLRETYSDSESPFITDVVRRGDLTITVTATGTLEPRKQVSIGTEVSGTVTTVFADYNDHVTKDQVLARLDTTILSAQLAQSAASLNVAYATKRESEATLAQMESEYARLLSLRASHSGGLVSEQEIESARTSRDRAAAGVESAQAQLKQAQAQYAVNETQLAKAKVVSPIDGVVLKRSVDPGQTVAAAFQAPELFTIAQDLRDMRLSIEIDEADIGKVREGQSATFVVDAYPSEEFYAEVTQVRLAPESSAGVVTYKAILAFANPDLRLLPGMTATAVVRVQQLSDVLLVPNTALRYSPMTSMSDAPAGGGLVGALIPLPSSGRTAPEFAEAGNRSRSLWLLSESGEPKNKQITVGATDGISTEVLGGALLEGARVVVDERGSS